MTEELVTHLAEVNRTAEQIACSTDEFALRRSLVLNSVLFKLITSALHSLG